MSLLDLASLVLAPTATKEGKVYSAIPDTGEGDMTFTRGSSATRVNSAGLIEKERGNLLLQSNSFDTTWTTTFSSVTGGQSGYDGSSDAWKLQNTSGGVGRVIQSLSTSGVQSFSIYAKGGNVDWMALYLAFSPTPYVYYDITNGVLGTSVGGHDIDAKIEAAGNGFYRCTITYIGSPTEIRVFIGASDGTLSTNSGDNIYIQDAQNEQGLVATDYIPTTTSAVYEGITDDVPRVDYSGGGCPALKLEPQRTNLLPNSEYLDGWTGTSTATITTNYTTSPEGVNNATRLQFAASSNLRHEQIISGAYESQSITVSVYAKSLTGNEQDFRLKCTHAGVLDYFSNDLTATNEWQRFVFTQAFGSSTGTGIVTGIFQATDNLAKDIAFYGFQVEASASYASSYIPTYSVSSTRVADSCSKTGISELIGQTEGTIYWEGVINGLDNNYGNIITSERNVTTSFSILARKSGMQFQCAVFDGSTKGQCNGGSLVFGTKHKLAYAYKSGDFALYVDGVQASTSTQTWSPSGTIDDIYIADLITFFGYKEGNEHNQISLFPTRLTNDQLEELTT